MSAANVKVSRSTVSNVRAGQQFDMGMLLGVVFLVMALLQLISFSSLKTWLLTIGFSGESAWATVIIIVEIVAALSLIRIALPSMARSLSWACAILAGGFWFVENLRLVSDNMAQVTNSGFFGKYLQQTPGWWTVIEAGIFLFWILYSLGLAKEE
jgi:hypothetical protein